MKPLVLANFNKVYHENDTWHGFTVKGFCIDAIGNRVAETHPPKIVKAILQFRDKRGILAYELNSDTLTSRGLPAGFPNNIKGTISISDDTDDWYISVNAQPLKLDTGVYDWELQLQDCNNVFFTLIRGEIFVTRDITYLQ